MANAQGLQVLDVTDPAAPELVVGTPVPEALKLVAVRDGHAFVAGDGGLYVIDFRNPGDPRITGTLSVPGGSARDIAVSRNRVFLAWGVAGLQVVDVGNPQAPAYLGQWQILNYYRNWANGVDVVGNTACVAYFGLDLQVIDTEDVVPEPEMQRIDIPGIAMGVGASRGSTHYYVASATHGLQVVDAGSRQPIREVATRGAAMDIRTSAERVFVGEEGGLEVFDISDPADPRPLGVVDLPGTALGVYVMGDLALVAAGDPGMYVVDVADPANPALLGGTDTPGFATGVLGTGSRAYVADGPAGCQVVDLTTPSDPRIVGAVETPGFAHAVSDISGGRFAIADGQAGVQIISGGTDPRILASLMTPGEVWDVQAPYGTFRDPLYLVGTRFTVTDVDEVHSTIRTVTKRLLPGTGRGVTIGAQVAVAAGSDGLLLFPLSCRSHGTPVRLLSFVAVPAPGGVKLAWVTAFEENHAGFHVYRSKGEEAPERITDGLVVGGPEYAYLDRTAVSGGRYRYELESVSRTGETERFGPVEIEVPPARLPAILAAPNPSVGETRIRYSLPEGGAVAVRVFDPAGRVVRTLHSGVDAAGTHHVDWDAADDLGRPVPFGIYFVSILSTSGDATTRVTILPEAR